MPEYRYLYKEEKVQAYLLGRSTQEAEGTPLERVQVVNSGARVQIPPSALPVIGTKSKKKAFKKLKKRFGKNEKKLLTNFARRDKINELLLRKPTTRWTLKMKD